MMYGPDKTENISKTIQKSCYHRFLEIGSELLATGILPTLSLECDYISQFPDIAQNRKLSEDFALIFTFILLEGSLEPRNAIKLSRLSRGSPDIQFCSRGLDRLKFFSRFGK